MQVIHGIYSQHSNSVDQRVVARDSVQVGRPYSGIANGCGALLGGNSTGYKDSGGTWLLPIACERERENVCIYIYTHIYAHTYTCNKLKIIIIKLKMCVNNRSCP